MQNNNKFLALLVSAGMLTREETQELYTRFQGDTLAVLCHLAALPSRNKAELGRLWGDSIATAYVDLDKTLFQDGIVRLLPRDFAERHRMIPLYRFGDTVTVATSDPMNNVLLGEARRLIGSPVSPVFSLPGDIEFAIKVNYQDEESLEQLGGKLANHELLQGGKTITDEQLKMVAGDKAVVELTFGILLLALKERASDIHVDPGEEAVSIRFRIDGVLQERLRLGITLLQPLVSRIKILATMDITERRRPQDGRISLPLTSRAIDFRISVVPTIHGEKVVLRVLGQLKNSQIPSLEELYLSGENISSLKRIIESPNGVFFVTGPTGSGKTTTLYAVLKQLNRAGVNIMTIEDPVEYRLPGINQIQVNHSIDLDFSTSLRSFLRQDPDIVLVGEIRDSETAKIAAQAALTGHLVLTTLHTNNALQAVTRLVEIGVEPFLVAPSIIGVMAQRLVRKLCDACKESYVPASEEVERLFSGESRPEVVFWRHKGCAECRQNGFSGRIAIHEILIINDEIRNLISRNASILEIQESARKSSFRTMHYDGIKKALRGLTTIEEVERFTRARNLS
jgi:type IV pilus assembly protein PilB